MESPPPSSPDGGAVPAKPQHHNTPLPHQHNKHTRTTLTKPQRYTGRDMDNPAGFWEGWRAASCVPDCFCEAVRAESWVRQPANTLSSLAFVLVGLWALRQPSSPSPFHPYRPYFVLATLLIGLGSAFYHASLSFAGQFWDVLGMYLLAVLMLLYRLRPGRLFGVAYGLSVALLALALWFWPDLRRWLFAATLLGAIGLELRHLGRHRPRLRPGLFLGGLALYALAFTLWALDATGALCDPRSWLQGHALWHALGALATAALLLYYTSERAPAQ